MFDLGWSEMLVIAILVIILVGPREIPTVLKTVMNMMAKVRELTRQFRSGVDDLIEEADLGDVKSGLFDGKDTSIRDVIGGVIDPDQSLQKTRQALETEVKASNEVPGFSSNDPFANPFSAPQSATADGAKNAAVPQEALTVADDEEILIPLAEEKSEKKAGQSVSSGKVR